MSPHILHSHPALFRQRLGTHGHCPNECTTTVWAARTSLPGNTVPAGCESALWKNISGSSVGNDKREWSASFRDANWYNVGQVSRVLRRASRIVCACSCVAETSQSFLRKLRCKLSMWHCERLQLVIDASL